MLVTLSGIVMEVRRRQYANANSPILVTLLGITIEVSPLQEAKAQIPMLVTLLGITIEVSPLQYAKALPSILVTVLGIVVFLHPTFKAFDDVIIIALQLLRESYIVFPSSTTIAVRLLQFSKGLSSIRTTLLGIVMEVRLLQ